MKAVWVVRLRFFFVKLMNLQRRTKKHQATVFLIGSVSPARRQKTVTAFRTVSSFDLSASAICLNV